MTERGVNSFDEFLLYYVFAGFIIGALWGVLEAHILLGPIATAGDRRARQRRLTRFLAPLGIAHPAFALIAIDVNRREEDEPSGVHEETRRRNLAEAKFFALAGGVLLAVCCAPHLPAVQSFPGIEAVERAIPWE